MKFLKKHEEAVYYFCWLTILFEGAIGFSWLLGISYNGALILLMSTLAFTFSIRNSYKLME